MKNLKPLYFVPIFGILVMILDTNAQSNYKEEAYIVIYHASVSILLFLGFNLLITA